MKTTMANIFANEKCEHCDQEWNTTTGEIFDVEMAQLLREQSGTHNVKLSLCAFDCKKEA